MELTFQRVLVVEDIEPVRRAIARTVRRIAPGVELLTANHGDEALEVLLDADEAGAPFDVCISDYHMPNRTGLSLVQDYQRTGEQKSTVFLLTTGRATVELLDGAQALGVPVIDKPFTALELEAALRLAFNDPQLARCFAT